MRMDLTLRIWPLCFGFSGSMNDLNILSVSPMFTDILAGKFPGYTVQYNVADEAFNWMYLLPDGIYPEYNIFISTIALCRNRRALRFSSIQEAVRKCVQRLFGVLFKRFGILQRPSRLWYGEDMQVLMQACCVLHNMLVEDRKEWFTGNGIGGLREDLVGMMNSNQENGITVSSSPGSLQESIEILDLQATIPADIKSKSEHQRLLNALVCHVNNCYRCLIEL